MNDRELLELAAKAACMADATYCELSGDAPAMHVKDYGVWDPLGDDGDALRLAVKLGLDLAVSLAARTTYTSEFGAGDGDVIEEHDEHGAEAATRRAITRAAAEIGAGMRQAGPATEGLPEDNYYKTEAEAQGLCAGDES